MKSPVATANGNVFGALDETTGVHSFKGIPYAAPPVGDLRWKAPQPVESWDGIRQAVQFGPRAMQLPVFGDMNFRSNGMSEDCLYLNVWTPDPSTAAELPVLVYFYGGGFIAGDGSEPRYDGAQMARRGIVALTVNYRLNIFGFMAHPELSAESPYNASGNYGYLDQHAALRWVRDNIAAFGGDPGRVTIAGESAGSISVNAHLVSPLSKDLIVGAIGASGGLGAMPPHPLADVEQVWLAFANKVGAESLAALRAMPAPKLLEATEGMEPHNFPSVLDGHFFPRSPLEVLSTGEQARVPLMVGWNSEEMNYVALLGSRKPTPKNYAAVVRELYGDHADEVLELYPGETADQVDQSATELAGDRFLVYSTWKWAEEHRRTGNPVYRYYYAHPRPPMVPEMAGAVAGLAGGVIRDAEAAEEAIVMPPAKGAVHSADIEYAMGNLATNLVYAWTVEDEQVSELMQGYYANFIKTGDPNGSGLPAWPRADEGPEVQVMVWDVEPEVRVDRHRQRYAFHDQLYKLETDQTLNQVQQSIIPIAAFTASGDLDRLKTALQEGLAVGLTVNEIKEILVHLYAYAGFPRSLNGINTFMAVMDERQAKGIQDEIGKEASPVPADLNKDEYGAKVRAKLARWGTIPPPSGYQLFTPAIDTFLKEHLFADIFLRDVLDHQSRELVTISALAAMTGTAGQLRFHLGAAMNIGLTEAQMQDYVSVLDSRVGEKEAEDAAEILAEVLSSRANTRS